MTTRKRPYSRLARVEETKAKRALRTYAVLTVLLIIGGIFFGFGLLSKVANLASNVGGSDAPIQLNDNTPPAPPRLTIPFDFTSDSSFTLTGTAESGATITLKVNGKTEEFVANSDGEFSTKVDLQKGENRLSATATDKAGNESQVSETYTVIQDGEPPELTIASPQNGSVFSGKDQNKIEVTGTTEKEAEVKVNGKVAIVDANGAFKTIIILNEGDNELKVVATDKAGNETEESITVSYSQ